MTTKQHRFNLRSRKNTTTIPIKQGVSCADLNKSVKKTDPGNFKDEEGLLDITSRTSRKECLASSKGKNCLKQRSEPTSSPNKTSLPINIVEDIKGRRSNRQTKKRVGNKEAPLEIIKSIQSNSNTVTAIDKPSIKDGSSHDSQSNTVVSKKRKYAVKQEKGNKKKVNAGGLAEVLVSNEVVLDELNHSAASILCPKGIQPEISGSNEKKTIVANVAPKRIRIRESDSDFHELHKIIYGESCTQIENSTAETVDDDQYEMETVWIADPNHLIDDQDEGEQSSRRTRNHFANKEEWPREISKAQRERGQAYIGYEKKESLKIVQDKLRDERKMGPRCTSKFCLKSVKRHCNEMPEVLREHLCYRFWNDMTWDQKKIYIISLIDVCDTQRKYVDDSCRSMTLKYFLRINKARKQVCKSFFLSTFALNEWMVYNWVKEGDDEGIVPAKQILNSRRAIARPLCELKVFNEQRKLFLAKFFEKLPKMESHYCRQQTEKKYLQPDFESLAEVYDFYKFCCAKYDVRPLSKCIFDNLFHSSKLGLFRPKKDRCDLCVSYEAGNVSQEEYENHLKLKTRAQDEKKMDKAKGVAGKAHVLLWDVQAVKLLPLNRCNSFYFKLKLKMHNFTIYNMATGACVNYWWHEGEGELTSSMFVTCILKYLEQYCNDELPIILWSDGCTYQNRNQILANALLDYAVRNEKEVTQKILEKGHTQMEVDHIHSLIERKLKNRVINLPSEYISITKTARRRIPLEAELLSHNDFKLFDDPSLYRYSGIRPGKYPGDPTVYDLRVLNYRSNGEIEYKINFDDDFKLLPGPSKNPISSYMEIKPYYTEPPKITERKYNVLQHLKSMLPQDTHYFYDSLKY